MSIAVLIIALTVGVVIPSVNNVTLAELRSSAGRLSGLIRQIYAEAVLKGQIHRIVFDFESNEITVEATDKVLDFDPESNALGEAEQRRDNYLRGGAFPMDEGSYEALLNEFRVQQDLGALVGEEEGGSGALDNPLSAFFKVNTLGSSGDASGDKSFQPVDFRLELKNGVRLLDVWIQGMNEPEASGRAYLYFFPHGFSQKAIVHLEDDKGRIFSTKVSPLTGKAQIVGEYVKADI